jgi:ABC-2 type transport system ATP-binding protein
MIMIENLSKYYGKVKGVDGISLEVKEGEIMAFLGPNGAGKTTTIKCILGLIKPTKGRITVKGMEIGKNEKEIKRLIGYLPQRIAFPENMTGYEVLKLFSRIRGVHKDRVEQILSIVGLSADSRRKVTEYSGGMVQRLGIAVALLSDPPILILDEPTISLDPEGAYQVKKLIFELHKSGKTIILSTHILSDIEELAGRIAIFHRGKIIEVDSLPNLSKKIGLKSKMTVFLHNFSQEKKDFLQTLPLNIVNFWNSTITIEISLDEKWKILKLLDVNGLEIADFTIETPSLEEVLRNYISLKGGSNEI